MLSTKWRVGIVVGLSLAIIGGFLITKFPLAVKHASNIIPSGNKPTPVDPLEPFSIAVLGYGGGTHDGGYLTDTIIQLHIQPRDKRIIAISIPRDLWVLLPLTKEGEHRKINAVYALGRDQKQYKSRLDNYKGATGGGESIKDALYLVTGLPVNKFISISFSAFTKGIDKLGGVEVTVPHTFEDPLYPIEEEKTNNCGLSEETIASITATLSGNLLETQFPCRYEQLKFEKGTQFMDGATALKYVRSRKSDSFGGDINRNIRQQSLILAVKNKLLQLKSLPSIIPFLETVTQDMQTDITAQFIYEKLNVLPDISSYELKTITFNLDSLIVEDKSPDGQYILIPKTGIDDFSQIQSYIREAITIPTPTP